MDITTDYKNQSGEIIALFTDTFTASEGADEGRLIGTLVTDILATVDAADLFVFSAREAGKLIGTIVFTRMGFARDDRTVFVLAPVAVAPDQQGKGVGQRLLRHGLDALRQSGVDIALTYGDINFYGRVGFARITEAEARPPLPLTYPEGWLGQALSGDRFTPLAGPSRCVAPLASPDYW